MGRRVGEEEEGEDGWPESGVQREFERDGMAPATATVLESIVGL